MTLYHQDGTPATEAEILSAASSIASSRKITHAGGRPKVLRKCPKCGLKLSAREMMRHTRCGASP